MGVFQLLFPKEGKKVLASKGFKDFFEANKEWLQPYAVFSYPARRLQNTQFP
jgi:4-alpha-glucanotransferase